MVLIKEVFIVIPIYWLSLACKHVSVKNILRKKMFNFLWSGEVNGKKIHLVKWESLAKPKVFGGRDIKSLCCFIMDICT